ncbi:MAG TPA: hypothetical protein VF074_09570, partial [Pyrinomonadaceae bacterium]
MPKSFSAVCIISFVMRGAGVGEAAGEAVGEATGVGVGLGVCANDASGRLDAAKPATPSAGNVFTKVRRSRSVFAFDFSFRWLEDRRGISFSCYLT